MEKEVETHQKPLLHAGDSGTSTAADSAQLTYWQKITSIRGLMLICAVFSLASLVISSSIDTYFITHSGQPVKYDKLHTDLVLPDAKIGALSLQLINSEGSSTYWYSSLQGPRERVSIDDNSPETFFGTDLVDTLGFRLPITSASYASSVGAVIFVFEVLSICCLCISIFMQLVFQREPDSFILRPAVSARVALPVSEKLKSGLPGLCLLFSAGFTMINAVLISSYVHNFVFRIVVFAMFNSGIDGSYLQALRSSLRGFSVPAKQEQLEFMQFIGRYLGNDKNVTFGYSFFGLILSIALNLLVLFTLYYRDNSIARSAVVTSTDDGPWNQLPYHCRVRSLKMSSSIFIFGLIVTAIGGNVARRRGVKMNRHPFEVESNPDGSLISFIDDVVISHTSDYFFSTAGLVDGAVMIFMPLLVMVAISSLDRKRFAAKVMELFGIIFFMRGIAVMSTIMPTLFNVLQHPQCWDKPRDGLKDMMMEKEFCNDLMFSGHTVFCMFPALIFVFSIVYGPYNYKPLLIGSVLLLALLLTSLIVIGRLHYTADVIVALTLTTLLVVMNSPVWKLQFSFRKSQLGVGSASAIDKVPSYLELCIERLNLYVLTIEETPSSLSEEGKHEETWTSVALLYTQLGELIESVEYEHGDQPNKEPSFEEAHADEKQALLGLDKDPVQ